MRRHLVEALEARSRDSTPQKWTAASGRGWVHRSRIAHLRSGAAVVDYLQLKAAAIGSDASVYGFAMKECWAKHRDFESLAAIYAALRRGGTRRLRVDPRTALCAVALNVYLNACAESRRPKLAVSELRRVLSTDSQLLDACHVAAALKCFAHTGEVAAAKRLVAECAALCPAIAADRVVDTVLLGVCAKARDHRTADGIVRNRLAHGSDELQFRTLHFWSALIKVYAKCRMPRRVAAVNALRKALCADSDEFSTKRVAVLLSTFYAASGRFHKAEQCLCQEACDDAFVTGARLNNQLLQMVALSGAEERRAVFERMKALLAEAKSRRIAVARNDARRRIAGRPPAEARGDALDTVRIRNTLMQALLCLHADDWVAAIGAFEAEHWRAGDWLSHDAVDLHLHSHETVAFALRFLFAKVPALRRMFAANGSVQLIVGRSLHSAKGSTAIGHTVLKEMRHWRPPVRCQPHANNEGVLVCDPKDTAQFFAAVPLHSTDFCPKHICFESRKIAHELNAF